MLNKFLIAAALLLFGASINAQAPRPGKSLYASVELGGNAVTWSANLDYLIQKYKTGINLRMGIEFLPVRIPGILDYSSVGALVEGSVLLGKKKNKPEFGVGLSYIKLFENPDDRFSEDADLLLLVPRIGYRFFNSTGKHFFKLALTPLILLDKNEPGDEWDNPTVQPFVGVSYGFRIKSIHGK
jgi:hypothetical protein